MCHIVEEFQQKGRKEGLKQGKQIGRRQGHKEGLRQGHREGHREGRRNSRLEMLRNMFNKNITLETIMELGFSDEEIRTVQSTMLSHDSVN